MDMVEARNKIWVDHIINTQLIFPLFCKGFFILSGKSGNTRLASTRVKLLASNNFHQEKRPTFPEGFFYKSENWDETFFFFWEQKKNSQWHTLFHFHVMHKRIFFKREERRKKNFLIITLNAFVRQILFLAWLKS